MKSRLLYFNRFKEAGGQVLLQCEASANPPPKYEWQQKILTAVTRTNDDNDDVDVDVDDKNVDEKVFLRGSEKTLEFRNVSYDLEGQWVCVASNVIKGKKNILAIFRPELIYEAFEVCELVTSSCFNQKNWLG